MPQVLNFSKIEAFFDEISMKKEYQPNAPKWQMDSFDSFEDILNITGVMESALIPLINYPYLACLTSVNEKTRQVEGFLFRQPGNGVVTQLLHLKYDKGHCTLGIVQSVPPSAVEWFNKQDGLPTITDGYIDNHGVLV